MLFFTEATWWQLAGTTEALEALQDRWGSSPEEEEQDDDEEEVDVELLVNADLDSEWRPKDLS